MKNRGTTEARAFEDAFAEATKRLAGKGGRRPNIARDLRIWHEVRIAHAKGHPLAPAPANGRASAFDIAAARLARLWRAPGHLEPAPADSRPSPAQTTLRPMSAEALMRAYYRRDAIERKKLELGLPSAFVNRPSRPST